MTKPQIDLMLNDQPVVDYKSKKKSVRGKNHNVNDIDGLRAKAELALAKLKAQQDAGTDGIENFEIKNGVTMQF